MKALSNHVRQDFVPMDIPQSLKTAISKEAEKEGQDQGLFHKTLLYEGLKLSSDPPRAPRRKRKR